MRKYTVTYMRFQQRHYKEFNSAKKAAQWTLDQEYQGKISYETITNPDGVVVANNRLDGYKDLYELGAKGMGVS